MASYDDLGKRLADRFALYANAVAGERALAVAAGLPAASLKRWSRVRQFRSAFAQDAERDLGLFMWEHLKGAPEVMQERGYKRLSETLIELNEITSQVQRQANRDLLGKSMRLVDMLGGPSGSIGLLAQRKMAIPTFTVEDASGRKWSGEKLTQTIVRDFAYQTYIDGEFGRAMNDGAQIAVLEHPDANHVMNGVELDISGPQDAWLALRDETFHINSRLGVTYATF